MLARHFVRRFSRELGRDVREHRAGGAGAAARRTRWPGNVRELQSVLKQALLNASGTILLPAFLPQLPDTADESAAGASSLKPTVDLEGFIRRHLSPQASDLYGETHRFVDRLLLTIALEYTHGNHRDAAKMLGISRQTMRTRFRTLGLQVTHSVDGGDDE